MKSKVSLSLMFEIGLLNANLTLSIEYIDSTNLHERCTIFQKLPLSSVKIFVLNDRNTPSLAILKKSRKTFFAQHSHVF